MSALADCRFFLLSFPVKRNILAIELFKTFTLISKLSMVTDYN